MNIKSINGSIGLFQNFGVKNKEEEKKPKLIEKMVSKAIVSIGTRTTDYRDKTQIKENETNNTDTYLKKIPNEDGIKTVTTHLKSGSIKTDKIKSDVYAGTFIESDFNPPVNGVAKMKITKNTSGDIEEINTFDKNGQVLKNIKYNRDFYSYWFNNHKPKSIVITDNHENTTKIYNDFLNNKPSQIKTVTIKTSDGDVKKTVVPHSLSDKVKDKAIDIKWKIKQSIN